MPEGDNIFRAARTLNRALAAKTVKRFESTFPKLARIHEDTPITEMTVQSVVARGKWIEMEFSGGLVLVTHMLMRGSWHIYRPGEAWKRPACDMRVLIATDDFIAVAFNIQVAEFVPLDAMDKESPSRTIKQDFLASDFDEQDALLRLHAADPNMKVGEALLRQSIVAGIGNVYKSEVAFACKVHPFATIAAVSEEQLYCLVQTARKFMLANVTDTSRDAIVTYAGFRRTTGRANPSDRLWVYGRAGKPCRRCGTSIRSRKQGVDARITFWCPYCQRLPGER